MEIAPGDPISNVFYTFGLKYSGLSNISQASNPAENDIATISEPPIEIPSYQRHR